MYIYGKFYSSSQVARWQVLSVEFDIMYTMREELKKVDHLVHNTMEDYKPLDFDFPYENVFSIKEKEKR